MQTSVILRAFHEAVLDAGHFPLSFCFSVAPLQPQPKTVLIQSYRSGVVSDNTKETKNSTMMAFAIWFLSIMKSTRLFKMQFAFPLVGHSHGPIDRHFAQLLIECLCDSLLTDDLVW